MREKGEGGGGEKRENSFQATRADVIVTQRLQSLGHIRNTVLIGPRLSRSLAIKVVSPPVRPPSSFSIAFARSRVLLPDASDRALDVRAYVNVSG